MTNANVSNHSGTFRQEDLSRIALLEKRLTGGAISPYTPHNDSLQGGSGLVGVGAPDTGTDAGPNGVARALQNANIAVANNVTANKANSLSNSVGHLVSDTPLHSAEEGKTRDGEEKEVTAEKVRSNKKRRVSKPPVRVTDEKSNGAMGTGRKGNRATVDLTKDASNGKYEGQDKRTPNQTQKSIDKYFTLSNKQESNHSVEKGLTHTSKEKVVEEKRKDTSGGRTPEASSAEKSRLKSLEKQAASLKEENAHLQEQLKQTQAACDALEEQVKNSGNGGEVSHRNGRALDQMRLNFLVDLATQHAVMARELKGRMLREDAPRLGTLSVQRKGIDVQEVWENGAAILRLGESYKLLQKQREQIDALRKATKRRLPLPGQPVPPRMDAMVESVSETGPIHPDDWMVQEEVFKARLAAIKREEDALKVENNRLEMEKNLHIRELKRLRDEEESRFGDHPVMNKRYLLLELLGKGGFSEVFKALDLNTLTYVAVKIHQLSSQWSESKKASYVKHSVREYHIHKGLHHPRIVSLLDIFEIDNNTFATVLEHCPGGDLEGYVKAHETLPEKEAKSIVSQIISGLLYLNVRQRSQTYIHYDLKPANILFDAVGQCKITDFGLSKVVEDGHSQGMELTSQGAGTYWYLPPECFDVQRTPMISNKVDVWSVGVILYQMVYGKRPFGHELSQEQILRNEVMRNATDVQFPAKPNTSNDCKDFIKQCLAYRQQDRPDVHQISEHKWLASGGPRRRENSGAR